LVGTLTTARGKGKILLVLAAMNGCLYKTGGGGGGKKGKGRAKVKGSKWQGLKIKGEFHSAPSKGVHKNELLADLGLREFLINQISSGLRQPRQGGVRFLSFWKISH